MSAVAEAAGVSKWYGEVLGLNTFTASFGSGITGLVGPNGAGKSTLFKLLIGQLRPNQGTVRLLGEDPWNNVRLMHRLGYCPEHNQLYGWLTGQEFVATLLRLDGTPKAKAGTMAEAALKVVGLSAAAHRPTRTYSRGMRQRVKLAQALAHDPEVLILDEPLSGADPLGRRKTIRMIKEWGRAGKSILVSSHILHEIESMTSNILLINQGRILAEGNVHQIRELIDEHPHTVYIKADQTRALAREFLSFDDVLSLKLEKDALVVQTGRPDAFYARLTALAASGDLGTIHEVTSPDDNLQAVFQYLVKA